MNSHKGPEKKNEKLKGSILNESSNIFVYFLGGGQVPVENVFLFAFWEGKQPIQKPSCETTFWTFAKNYNMKLFIAWPESVHISRNIILN